MTFEQFARAIVSSTGNVVLCGAIVAVAVAIYFLYLLPRTRKTRRELLNAVSRLDAISDQVAFARSFSAFDEFARQHPLLGHSWREFADTLMAPAPGGQPDYLRNSREAAEFFNLESVLATRLNTRFVTAVPGYMTGLGILGTFIGLVAGIYLASIGMDTSDLQKMRASLQPLLSGAALAFWTSICGLLCSLAFSIAEKSQFHRIEKALAKWNEGLDQRLRRVTPEQLVAEQVAEAARQTLQLERFNTDLAVSIAQALESRLSSSLTPRLDLLVTGLDALKSHQAEFSQDLLNKVSTDIARAVSGAAGTEMSTIAGTLTGLVSTLQQAAGALSQGHGELATAVDNMVGKMQAAFGESSSQMNNEVARAIQKMITYLDAASGATATQLRDAGTSLATAATRAADGVTVSFERATGAMAERLSVAADGAADAVLRSADAVQKSLAGYESTIKQVQELLKASGEAQAGFKGTLQAFQETHGAFRSTVVPLQQAITQLGGVQETLSKQLEHTRSLSEALTGASHEAKQTLLSLQQAWASHEQRFASVDASAERFFGQIREGLDSYTTVIRTFVGELDEKFAKALHELGSVVNELETTVDGLEQTVRRQAGVR